MNTKAVRALLQGLVLVGLSGLSWLLGWASLASFFAFAWLLLLFAITVSPFLPRLRRNRFALRCTRIVLLSGLSLLLLYFVVLLAQKGTILAWATALVPSAFFFLLLRSILRTAKAMLRNSAPRNDGIANKGDRLPAHKLNVVVLGMTAESRDRVIQIADELSRRLPHLSLPEPLKQEERASVPLPTVRRLVNPPRDTIAGVEDCSCLLLVSQENSYRDLANDRRRSDKLSHLIEEAIKRDIPILPVYEGFSDLNTEISRLSNASHGWKEAMKINTFRLADPEAENFSEENEPSSDEGSAPSLREAPTEAN